MTEAAEKIQKSTPGHGGKRAGSGRPVGHKQSAPAKAYEVLAKAKAKRETYRAQMAEVEYRQKIGELLEAEEVKQLWAEQVAIAKGRMLALPARLAPAVIGVGDLRTIEGLIRDAIYEALTELSSDE